MRSATVVPAAAALRSSASAATVALTAAATLRQETRGSHWRDDHPARDDARWSGHVDVTLDDDGVRREPLVRHRLLTVGDDESRVGT